MRKRDIIQQLKTILADLERIDYSDDHGDTSPPIIIGRTKARTQALLEEMGNVDHWVRKEVAK